MSLDIFKEMEKSNTEQIVFNYNKETGLKSIMAINDTTLGPAMGGCRMMEYESTDEAILDAIRLAVGMTYKISVAGENYGGGKTVVIGDPKKDKNEVLLRDLGRAVQMLNGRYYMGTDVGTSGNDMVYSALESDYIVGLPAEYGGFGDSSKPTAYGIYMAIKASAKTAFGNDSLRNLTVAVQGAGAVGSQVVEYLAEEGAKILLSDMTEDNIKALTSRFPEIEVVDPDKIYEQDCDVFTPCALGGIINDETIPKFKCKIIAGSANNQLAEPRHGKVLHNKGILFAPDFVINSGGFISAADTVDMGNASNDRVMAKTEKIYDTVLEIFSRSKEEDTPTVEIANKLAEDRIKEISKLGKNFIGD